MLVSKSNGIRICLQEEGSSHREIQGKYQHQRIKDNHYSNTS
nr:MAG TPA: hypothetical protein [Caudoviricetes sp.]